MWYSDTPCEKKKLAILESVTYAGFIRQEIPAEERSKMSTIIIASTIIASLFMPADTAQNLPESAPTVSAVSTVIVSGTSIISYVG